MMMSLEGLKAGFASGLLKRASGSPAERTGPRIAAPFGGRRGAGPPASAAVAIEAVARPLGLV